MNLLKEAAKFIGWLAGSIAGISAILGAFGFIIHRSQMHLLGLDAFMEFDTEFYVQEGAKFIVVLWSLAQKSFLPFLIIIVLFFLPVFFLFMSVRKRFEPFLNRLKNFQDKRPWLWKACILVAIVFPLLFHLMTRFEAFRVPLSIHHLFYGDADTSSAVIAQETKILKMGHPTGNGETH